MGTTVLTLGLLTLAACAPRTMHWSPVESPKKNQVSWAEFHHPVQFAGAATTVSKTEQDALLRFLHRVGRGQGVRIELAAGASDNTRLGLQREMALADVLRKSGYAVSIGESPKGKPSPDDIVRVTVGRHLVKAPACPDWSKPATGDSANHVSSNFGCATETNFGLMVADPGVLLHGVDEVGPADGEAATVGIRDYRKGDVEKLKALGTKNNGK
jgi:pilus assembly protein CpaD